MLKLRLTKLLSIALVAILVIPAVATLTSTPVSAYSATNLARFAQDDMGNNSEEFYIRFQYEAYFDDVDRDTLFEFMEEIQNDDLWCDCSQTTVIREGWGSKKLGRQWEQFYSFAGLQDHIIYTRLWLKDGTQHSWMGQGIFADIVADYRYEDLPGGGTKWTFDGIYRPNFAVPEFQIEYILQTLRTDYEEKFIPHFGSTGHVDLTVLDFLYI